MCAMFRASAADAPGDSFRAVEKNSLRRVTRDGDDLLRRRGDLLRTLPRLRWGRAGRGPVALPSAPKVVTAKLESPGTPRAATSWSSTAMRTACPPGATAGPFGRRCRGLVLGVRIGRDRRENGEGALRIGRPIPAALDEGAPPRSCRSSRVATSRCSSRRCSAPPHRSSSATGRVTTSSPTCRCTSPSRDRDPRRESPRPRSRRRQFRERFVAFVFGGFAFVGFFAFVASDLAKERDRPR